MPRRRCPPPLPLLQPEIGIPDGWRDGFVDRAELPGPAAPGFPDPWQEGLIILAQHRVVEQSVSVVRRVEGGVFQYQAAKPPALGAIAQIDTHHWWSPASSEHAAWTGQGPAPLVDWRLELFVQDKRDNDDPPPPNGTIIPIPWAWWPRNPIQVKRLWPALRFGLVSYSAHAVVVGPRWIALVARWVQAPRALIGEQLNWALAKSWGLMEGVDLRHATEDARRILLGGIP
jgi:hypothetical protein